MSGIVVAVVGLRFGADFVPIYLDHPDVRAVVVADADAAVRDLVGMRFGVETEASLDDVLARPDVDAVHIATPVRFHADHAVAVLESGRDCACAVPMATSLDDVARIVDAERASGRRYTMMETMLYGREYLYVDALRRDGRLGNLTYYEGFHLQNLDGFPEYWAGYPPMHYLTHALSPALALLDTDVESVRALGSGRLVPERQGWFDNPFPTETGLFTLRGSDVAAQVTVSFFDLARPYREGFHVYGDSGGVEWPVHEGEPLHVYSFGGSAADGRGRRVTEERVVAPDRPDLLPEPLARYTRPTVFRAGAGGPVEVGAAHSGSHPHLVHEFVDAVTHARAPRVDAARAAELTAPGICAHTSALARGEPVDVPRYRETTSVGAA